MIRRFALMTVVLAMTACDDDPELAAGTEEASGAQGEILGGTISDDMLPLDTVRSQAPTRAGNPEGDGAQDGDDAEETGLDEPEEEG